MIKHLSYKISVGIILSFLFVFINISKTKAQWNCGAGAGTGIVGQTSRVCPDGPGYVTVKIPGVGTPFQVDWVGSNGTSGTQTENYIQFSLWLTPPGAGAVTYSVSVTSSSGTCALSSFTFPAVSNYTSGGTISAPSSSSGYCSFNAGVITSVSNPSGGWGGTLGASYQWYKSTNGGGSWSPISGATDKDYNPPSISQTTMYKRGARRCSSYSYEYSNIVTLTVNPNITNAGSISGTNESGCSGYTPSGMTGTDLGSNIDYRWSWSSGYSSGGPNYNPWNLTSTRTYTRRAKRPGCTSWIASSGSIKKTVVSSPTVNISASSTSVCSGAAVTLTASGASSYSWSGGGSGTTKTVYPTSSTNYTVTGTNSAGCAGTATIGISVTACCDNVTSAGSITGNQSVCGSYNPSTITTPSGGSPSGGSGSLQYIWRVKTTTGSWSTISGATSSTYDPGTISSTRQYQRGVRRSGCTPYSYSNTVTKTVKSKPSVSASASPSTVCSGAAVSLSASGASSYLWSSGLGYGQYKTAYPTSSGYYYVTGTTNGCSSSASRYVTVNTCCSNITSTGSISGDESICGSYDPDVINNAVSPTGGSGTLQYVWQYSTNNVNWYTISGANNSTYNPSTITQTTYYKRGARRSGCTPYTYGNVVEKKVTANITTPYVFLFASLPTCGSWTVGNMDYGPASGGDSESGTIEYQWFISTDNVNWTAISGATNQAYTHGTITQTTYFKRGAKRSGCNDWVDSPVATATVINNFTDGGTISGNESRCGTFAYAGLISSTTGPTGGNDGSVQYEWYKSTNNINWSTIAGATASTYDPGTVPTTTYYRRGARRFSCMDYVLSNVVMKEVSSNVTTGGTIAANETNCGAFNPNAITSTALATGGGGATIVYQWESQSGASSWTPITGATNISYDPGTISVTTKYRRGAKRSAFACSTFYSNEITKTVIPGMTNNGMIAGDQTVCGAYDPTLITSTATAVGPGTLEYQWFISTDNSSFTPISGATGLTYDPSSISNTRYFKRGVRTVGCPNFTYSNTVEKVVVINYTDAGTIGADESNCGAFDPAAIYGITYGGGGSGPGSPTYNWEVSSDDVNWSVISGAILSSTYDPSIISATRHYRRGMRKGICTDHIYSNTITKVVAENFTSGGTIGTNQTNCGAFDPPTLTSIADPSGGVGDIEYMWEMSSDNVTWIAIPGGNAVTYDPPTRSSTTYYRRSARRTPCTSFVQSNMITIEIYANFSDGGSIAANESECGNYDPLLITSVSSPSGAVGSPEYQWKSSTDSITWVNIPSETNAEYDPPVLTVDSMFYMRGARITGCPDFALSNGVSKRKSPDCWEDCTNGIDDNGDGLMDCDDIYCQPEIESVLAVDGACPCGSLLGSISITAAGDQVTAFSIDGGISFYASGTFTDLEAGNYTIMIKNALSNCTPTAYVGNPVVITAPICPEICNNGIDDDCDGKVDCDDETCKPAKPTAIILD